jgi:hypothetical protein
MGSNGVSWGSIVRGPMIHDAGLRGPNSATGRDRSEADEL